MSTLNSGLSARHSSLQQHSTQTSALVVETAAADQDPINDEVPDSRSREAEARWCRLSLECWVMEVDGGQHDACSNNAQYSQYHRRARSLASPMTKCLAECYLFIITPSPIHWGTRYCFRSISLFVCLYLSCFFVSKITSKRLERFAWNFQERCRVTMRWPDYIFG